MFRLRFGLTQSPGHDWDLVGRRISGHAVSSVHAGPDPRQGRHRSSASDHQRLRQRPAGALRRRGRRLGPRDHRHGRHHADEPAGEGGGLAMTDSEIAAAIFGQYRDHSDGLVDAAVVNASPKAPPRSAAPTSASCGGSRSATATNVSSSRSRTAGATSAISDPRRTFPAPPQPFSTCAWARIRT